MQSKPTLTKAGLAAGAAGAAGFLIFQEAGTVLEVLGVLAGVRFLGNRFLFAKDREQTLELLRYGPNLPQFFSLPLMHTWGQGTAAAFLLAQWRRMPAAGV